MFSRLRHLPILVKTLMLTRNGLMPPVPVWLLLLAFSLVMPVRLQAQGDGPYPPAELVNDEGGAVAITGEVSYTNAYFTVGIAMPVVILEDQAGFVDRNSRFIVPLESQTLGQITSDFQISPFSYAISLPVVPQGTPKDVDNNGRHDDGVMIFAVAYWTNIFGDAFLERRDLMGGGWSTAYASTRVGNEFDTKREIVGGKFLVYAPNEFQGFPTSFGEDGLLFTDDDPIIGLPKGYTVVDMDTEPFTFDRSRNPIIDLIEPASAALADYSALRYSTAFDVLIDKLRQEYAFTEFKDIDWDALHAEFSPRFKEAETAGDKRAYRRALRDFSFAVPDGHVKGPFIAEDFRLNTGGGIGMTIGDLDDGRVIATYLVKDGPAMLAGIRLGATILAWDGRPIDKVVEQTVAWSAPFSTPHFERLQKLRYVVRSPIGTDVAVTYRNPGSEDEVTVTLTSIGEQESFRISSLNAGRTGFELPIEYQLLENGFGYVKVNSFSDNKLLTIQLWERLIRTLKEQSIPGLIIDMRQNSGGSGFLADQMAAYFFDDAHELGNTGFYDHSIDDFYFDERTVERFYLPPETLRYDGNVAILSGPNCNSACEFFIHDMTIDDRATVVAQFPTAGLGGSVEAILMPESEYFQFTAGRSVDVNGNIHVEGRGIEPDIRVPRTEKTVLGDDDPVLAAAVEELIGSSGVEIINGGILRMDAVTTGKLEPLSRVRYTLHLFAGDVISIYLEDNADRLDTVLRIYDRNGNIILENDDALSRETVNSALELIEIPSDISLTVEAASYRDEASGQYTLSVISSADVAAEDRRQSTDESTEDGGWDRVAGTAAGPKVVPTPAITTAMVAGPAVADSTNAVTLGAENGSGLKPVPAPIAVSTTASEMEIVTDSQSTQNQRESVVDFPLGIATVRTSGARLSVRSTPDPEAQRITYLPNGSAHQILAISADGNWLRIALPSDPPTGWIAVAFVVLSDGR